MPIGGVFDVNNIFLSSEFNAYLKQIKMILSSVKILLLHVFFSLVTNTTNIFHYNGPC